MSQPLTYMRAAFEGSAISLLVFYIALVITRQVDRLDEGTLLVVGVIAFGVVYFYGRIHYPKP